MRLPVAELHTTERAPCWEEIATRLPVIFWRVMENTWTTEAVLRRTLPATSSIPKPASGPEQPISHRLSLSSSSGAIRKSNAIHNVFEYGKNQIGRNMQSAK